MKRTLAVCLSVSLLVLSGCESVSPETWTQLGGLMGKGGLSPETVVAGLKDALRVGSERASSQLSAAGGYGENPLLKLVVPEQLEKVAETMRKVGFGSVVDSFEAKMNVAAEEAAAQAAPVFLSAIQDMTFEDANAILKGGDDAATLYFKGKTSAQLRDMYEPIVRRTMDEVGAAKIYSSLVDNYAAIPLTKKPDFALESYVTDKALDGLFLKLADMEKSIRSDPAARTTALLKQVFGSR